MTNKKIASEIAVGIILMIAIIVGGVFWLQDKKEKIVVTEQPAEISNQIAQKPQNQGGQEVQKVEPMMQGSFIVIPKGNINISNENIFSGPIKQDIINEVGFANSYSLNDSILSSPTGEKYIVKEGDVSLPLGSVTTDGNSTSDLTSMIMPLNPKDESIVFLSRAESLDKNNTCRNEIYSYNIKTGDAVKIYEEDESRIKGSDACMTIKTIGIKGSQLIVMAINGDSSPGPCTDYWNNYPFYYLELSDIKTGLKKFIVPKDRLIQSKKEIQKCEQELGVN